MSKKMCSEKISTLKKSSDNPHITNQSGVLAARHHDIPTYKENGAGAYIEFRAYDPEQGKMRRKTIKLNRIKGITNRRTYARQVIKRLIEQLNNGWNPWIACKRSLKSVPDSHSKMGHNRRRSKLIILEESVIVQI